MELRDWARAIAHRWVVVVAGAVTGLVLAGAVALLTPVSYASSVSLYVGAAVVDGPQDPAYAALVETEVLPSIAALTRSARVLAPVADRLGRSTAPADLAGRVDVAVSAAQNLVTVTATDRSPRGAETVAESIGEELPGRVAEAYPGVAGPLLNVTVVEPAGTARPAAPAPSRVAVLGAGAGAGLAVVVVGLLELARPRVRGRRDVAGAGSTPVLAQLPQQRPPGRSGSPDARRERAEQVVRLREALRPRLDRGTLGLVAAGRPATATALADDLRGLGVAGAEPVVLPAPPRPQGTPPPVGGVVVVADGRATTRAELQAALASAAARGTPVLGVVVDGLLPRRAGWRARLRAGLHGDGNWRPEATRPRDGRQAGGAGPVAALAVAAVGFDRPLPMALSTGLLVAAVLVPVWAPVVRRSRGGTALFVLAGTGLLSGLLLAWTSSGDHGVAPHEAVAQASAVLTTVCGIGLLLWARTLLPVPAIGVAFGAGGLAAGLLSAAGSSNAWKFELSFPVAVIVLSLVAARARPLATVAALGLLGVVDVLHDYRSAFAFCALAAVLVLWQARPNSGSSPPRRWVSLALLGALAVGGYLALRQLLLTGALGAELQARTVTQIAQSGSLLLGGRPEWTATWALMERSPLGFGLGVVPSAVDLATARQGIAATRIPTVDGYLEHQLLAGAFQLHSAIADLWAALGPVGVLLGLAMGALMVLGLVDRLAHRQASGLVCFLVPLGLWSLAFGPLSTDARILTLALGLLLVTRRPAPPTRAGEVSSPPPAVSMGRGAGR
ncbi:hypothetical protein ACI8AC_03340 [Geodermatophilus sp. SYSU D00758]